MKKLEIEKLFIESMQLKMFSQNTIKAYCYHWDKFASFKLDTHVSILSSQDIKDYLLHLKKHDVSDSFHNQAINSIRFMFKYVLNRKIKDYLVIRPKKAHTQPILLSDDEVKSLFINCHNQKHYSILAVIYSAGLRVSEVINLKLTDIDSKCMVIRVRSSKGRKDRQCLLDSHVLQLLREYYSKYKPKEYLFENPNGGKYSVRSIQKIVKALAEVSGITKRVYCHLLRHQQITGLIENGTDLYATQYHSGHKTIKTTSEYIHLSPKYISSIQSPFRNVYAH